MPPPFQSRKSLSVIGCSRTGSGVLQRNFSTIGWIGRARTRCEDCRRCAGPRPFDDYRLREVLLELADIQITASPGKAPTLTQATQKQLAFYERLGVARPEAANLT